MPNLLYVCRYNLDRSPVAEQLTRSKVRDASLHVSSAGLSSPPDGLYLRTAYLGMTDSMRAALERLGYAHEMRVIQPVTADLLRSQHLILCMEKSHVDEVLQKTSGLEGKVYALPEYAGFPDVVIDSPSQLIGRVPAFFILRSMPHCVRSFVYDALRRTDPRDWEGVVRVHMRVVRQIELCVDKALERMVEEGFISG